MQARPLPWFGWLGIALILLGQLLTLVHLRPLSDWWYGICWTGVILAGDAWVERRTGRSLVRDRPRDLLWMAIVSAVLWWGLELANHAMQVWEYSPSDDIPIWRQRLRSTYFFATLIPATWVTGMVVLTLWPVSAARVSRARADSWLARGSCMAVGVVALLSATQLPEFALGLILLGVLMALDPINFARGRQSAWACLMCGGDCRVPVSFAVGAMAMGVVGEMWNYPASPKWTYDVPLIDFAYVFEMPLLGFFGYGLLALTIFAVYQFARLRVLGSATPAGEDPLSLTGL
jgi:hypothetical protein